MNTKHLAKGFSCPPLISGSLRIYSMRYCPYAHRALLAAAAKGIKYDVVNINLGEKPEFIFQKNPEGKVPTIESSDGKILYESLIVADFLTRLWIVCGLKNSQSLDFQLYFPTNLEQDQIKALITQINDQLMNFEMELKRRGTKYFSGNNKPGMLDYMIWPWMERLPSLPLIYKNESSMLLQGMQACSSLKQWEQAMIEDNAVKESYLPPEVHAEYRQMRRKGGVMNYDFRHTN